MSDSIVYETLKLITLGDHFVGMTEIMKNYNEVKQDNINHIICDFLLKKINKFDKNFKIQTWDSRGRERFRSQEYLYYKDTDGVLLVYDITNRESFINVSRWMVYFIKRGIKKNSKYILVGNKCDLESQRSVSFQEGQELANSLGIDFFETSAKYSINITKVFDKLIDSIIETNSKIETNTIIKTN